MRFRLSILASALLAVPAIAGSPTPTFRVPTGDTNIDQICTYLPGSTTPRCDRTINKTTGAITIMAAGRSLSLADHDRRQ